MTSASAVSETRTLLVAVGYDNACIRTDYPVWLGRESGVRYPDLVAFGRAAPLDMSTAGVTLTLGRVEMAFPLAQALAAPFFFCSENDALDLWIAEAHRPLLWRTQVTLADVAELAEWIRPSAALTAKLGLRQLPLFDVPVNLLAAAKARGADRLTPLVTEALAVASQALSKGHSRTPSKDISRLNHRISARLVVGALTTLVMRDRANINFESADALIKYVAGRYETTYDWLNRATSKEYQLLVGLVDRLGEGIDYRSLDPTVLSQVYEEVLVSDDDRRRLGIHYTPPRLASRLLTELPVELVPPDERHVLDPACGSGTLLVAAHDRLRDLQPDDWSDERRHRDLAVHLRGFDIDPFAVEIARLTLLLHALPAGNGWDVEERDTLLKPFAEAAPKIIVTNPPWKYLSEDGQRRQTADAFVRWSLETLAPGGLLGILLPLSWLTAKHSSDLRSALLKDLEVFEIWRLPEGTFETSGIATAVVLARKRDGLGGSGARLVREVHQSRLHSFLEGEPPTAQYLFRLPVSQSLSQSVELPPLTVKTVRLEQIAVIRSGPQPNGDITDRGDGTGAETPFLRHFGDVRPYGLVDQRRVWHVRFPDDFQNRSRRGAAIIGKRKILVSAARNSTNPWQLRVAIDLIGVAPSNSVRGVAPKQQDDDDTLYALCILLGSGFAATFAATFGGDRNLSARVLKTMPIPVARDVLTRLATMGRRAVEVSEDRQALNTLLRDAEEEVWGAYGIGTADRAAYGARFRGHDAPEGAPRYPEEDVVRASSPSTFRRLGAVLEVEGDGLRVWVNGVTDERGIVVGVPMRMPGWLARPGATFDVIGVDTVTDLTAGRYRLQPMAWADPDLSAEVPAPLQRA